MVFPPSIAASAALFSIVKHLGAAYLVYIGLQAIFSGTDGTTRPSSMLPMTTAKAFRQAVVVEVLNPKTALFFLAFLPQFVHPQNGTVVLQLTALGAIFVMCRLLSTAIFAVSAAKLGRFLRTNPAVQKWQGKMVGGLFCALGARLALQER